MADDRAREDFFSEAQEIIEGYARDLLALEDGQHRGDVDPDLINDVFRAVHTLKGLAGLFNAGRMGTVAHNLEELLDDLRLGRRPLDRPLLDVLFRSVDVCGALLLAERHNDRSATPEADVFLVDLAAFLKGQVGGSAAPAHSYELDAELLGVLTEYEEHRLQTNIQNGFLLFRVRAQFNLMTLDEELDRLKAAAKPIGEIITYLPSGDGGDIESIHLEILLASRSPLDQVVGVIGTSNVKVEEVPRKRNAPRAPLVPGPPERDSRQVRDGAGPTPAPEPHDVPSSVRVPHLGEDAREIPSEPAPVQLDGTPLSTSGRTPGPAPVRIKQSDISELRGKAEPQAPGMSLRSVSQTVRVDIRKLDRLMNVVGELAIVRSSLGRITERVRSTPSLRDLASEMHRLHRTFERHLSAMQDGILEVRMVPLGQIFDKLGRVVRQASREAGKQVNLVITGAETEVDKLIVEELSDPLVHMIRNAIDHGIENRADRIAVEKPETGTVAINAFQKGSHVVIEVEDDGRGIDENWVREVAVQRGFVTESEVRELGRRDVYNLLFVPGFSTKTSADMLAGRGVGMDIVKTNISRLGGFIDIQSEKGIGTKMTITLPITLAILSALVIGVGAQTFALPLSSVQEALVFDESTLRSIEGRDFMTLRGTTLPIARLARLFGIEGTGGGRSGKGFVVVISAGARRLGLVVDHLEGQQDIVIKPLGASLRQTVRGFAGATELGDQRVGLVLDTPALVDEVLSSTSDIGVKGVAEVRSLKELS